MIGTPENPLVVPYDGMPEKTVTPPTPAQEPITPLQEVNPVAFNPDTLPSGTLLKVDKTKGGVIPLAPGEDPSIAVAKIENGTVVQLEQPQLPVQAKTKWYSGIIGKLL
ncbi:hypothetical protein H6768_05025 [Candidatus Peribacteria bacterium]|nr:hypothetical protein [Candidatus Peribacteria bacterium]